MVSYLGYNVIQLKQLGSRSATKYNAQKTRDVVCVVCIYVRRGRL